MIEKKLGITWDSFAIFRSGLGHDFFAKLRASGCRILSFGLESASDRVLKRMDKTYDQLIAEQTVRACSEAGIRALVNVIVGYPGETEADFGATLDFLRRNRPWIAEVAAASSCVISPGSALYCHKDRYGVVPDEASNSWKDEFGVGPAQRRDRLNELLRVVEELKFRVPRVINREPEPAPAPQLTITGVRLLDAMDQETSGLSPSFKTGEPLTVSIEFEAARPIHRPLFRIQIFNDENTEGASVFVFGQNNDRFNLRIDKLKPGRGAARLVIHKLNFLPGEYHVTAGVWPDEESGTAYDVRYNSVSFRVPGDLDPLGAKARVPHEWSDFSTSLAAGEGLNQLVSLKIASENHPGATSRAEFKTLENAALWIEFETTESGRYRIEAEIMAGDVPAARFSLDRPLPKGRAAVALAFKPINLLQGAYTAVARLVDSDSGRTVSSLEKDFKTESNRPQGAGLVFSPCAWDFNGLPK